MTFCDWCGDPGGRYVAPAKMFLCWDCEVLWIDMREEKRLVWIGYVDRGPR